MRRPSEFLRAVFPTMWDDSPQIRALRRQAKWEGWPLLLILILLSLMLLTNITHYLIFHTTMSLIILPAVFLLFFAGESRLFDRLHRSLPVSTRRLGLLKWELSVRWPALLFLIVLFPWALGLAFGITWAHRLSSVLIMLTFFALCQQLPMLWSLGLLWVQNRGDLCRLAYRCIGSIADSLILMAFLTVYYLLFANAHSNAMYADPLLLPHYLPLLLVACMIVTLPTLIITYRYAHIAVMNCSVQIPIHQGLYRGKWRTVIRILAGGSETVTNATLKVIALWSVLITVSFLFEPHAEWLTQQPENLLLGIHLFLPVAITLLLVKLHWGINWEHIRLLKILPLTDRIRFLRTIMESDIALFVLPPILSACIFLSFRHVVLVTGVAIFMAALAMRVLALSLNPDGPFSSDTIWSYQFIGAVLLLLIRLASDHIIFTAGILVISSALLYTTARICYDAVKNPQGLPRHRQGGPA